MGNKITPKPGSEMQRPPESRPATSSGQSLAMTHPLGSRPGTHHASATRRQLVPAPLKAGGASPLRTEPTPGLDPSRANGPNAARERFEGSIAMWRARVLISALRTQDDLGSQGITAAARLIWDCEIDWREFDLAVTHAGRLLPPTLKKWGDDAVLASLVLAMERSDGRQDTVTQWSEVSALAHLDEHQLHALREDVVADVDRLHLMPLFGAFDRSMDSGRPPASLAPWLDLLAAQGIDPDQSRLAQEFIERLRPSASDARSELTVLGCALCAMEAKGAGMAAWENVEHFPAPILMVLREDIRAALNLQTDSPPPAPWA